MMWACGLVLVLLFPQFLSIREIDFSGTIAIDIENELLTTTDQYCGKKEAVNLQNLDLSMIPTHMIKSDKIRHVDLSFNSISNIPNSFFLDVPNIECLNLTANAHPPISVLSDSNSNSLKTLVLDRMRCDECRYYGRNACTMTGDFPHLEILHLNNIEKCSIDVTMEARLPQLTTLYLMGYGSDIEPYNWQLPTTLRHLHLEGTRFNNFSLIAISNLQSLYLDNVHYKDTFNIPSKIVNLRVLSCRNCSLSKRDIETFFDSPRKSLRLLDLSHNLFYRLPDNMFQHASNLDSLILSHNMLSIMPDMQHLSQLNHLVLSYNIFNEVQDRKSNSLKMLSLRGNIISEIKNTSFQGYPFLKVLDLSENILASLPIGWADKLVNLGTLNLESNLFVRLSDTSLTSVTHELKHLFMSVHPIYKLDVKDFELLPKLSTIHFMLRNETIASNETFLGPPKM